MPTRTVDGQIDRLYQLPLDEFTDARNALAKELGQQGSKDGGEVRKLPKPPAAAWAVNQLFWSRRSVYDALIAAASAMRAAHGQVLAGKRADLRAAGSAHEETLDAAVKETLAILARSAQPASDATRQAVINTLRALPVAGEPPGRLARTLQPGGFELLAGLPIGPGGKPAPAKPPPPARETPAARLGRDRDQQRERALATAKEAVATAQRIEKTAEQQARREEFEAARTAREAERAEAKAADARAAVEAALAAAEEADSVSAAAARKKEAAVRRARERADALARARVKTAAAQAELARLQGR